MSDKLLSYLDSFPQICSIWVNSNLEYIGGPAEGFVKMTRDEAIDAALYGLPPVKMEDATPSDDDGKKTSESVQEQVKEPITDPPVPKIEITKPPKS